MASPYVEPQKPKRYTVKVNGHIVGRAELRRVPVDAVRIDPAYQRDVSQSWVDEHLPFNDHQAGAIVVSVRAGILYAIDGGHRLALARASGVAQINAFVIDGLSQHDEADLFVRYQRERRNLRSFDLFRADLVRGDTETLAMVRVVNNAGLQLAKHSGDFNITAIDAVRWIHRYGGDDLLARTLAMVKQIWLSEEKALTSQVLKGLAIFLQSAGSDPHFQVARLERIMESTAPSKLIRLSQAIAAKRVATSAGPANLAEALHELYQKSVRRPQDRLGPLTVGRKRRGAPRRPRVDTSVQRIPHSRAKQA